MTILVRLITMFKTQKMLTTRIVLGLTCDKVFTFSYLPALFEEDIFAEN